MIHTRIKKSHKATRKLVVGRKCSVAHPHVAGLLVMLDLDEGKVGTFLGPSAHDSLDLKGTNLYELVDLKLLKNLFKVVSD